MTMDHLKCKYVQCASLLQKQSPSLNPPVLLHWQDLARQSKPHHPSHNTSMSYSMSCCIMALMLMIYSFLFQVLYATRQSSDFEADTNMTVRSCLLKRVCWLCRRCSSGHTIDMCLFNSHPDYSPSNLCLVRSFVVPNMHCNFLSLSLTCACLPKKPFLCTKPMAANSCCFLFMLKIGLLKSRSRKCKSLLIVCSLMQISQRWICMGYCASSIVYTFGMRRRSVWTVLKSLWAGNAWWPMILSFVPLQNHIYCSNVLRCTHRKTLI